MNKSDIDWTDYSWNPITGCLTGCRYCYAKAMSHRFAGDVRLNLNDPRKIEFAPGMYILKEKFITRKGRMLNYPFGFAPTFHEYRLDELSKTKAGKNVFVGSMSDVFGAWVPDEWITEIFNACRRYPQHNYIFLTKNPWRYIQFYKNNLLPVEENMWFGASATDSEQLNRAQYLSELPKKCNTFLSVEPLLEDITMCETWQQSSVDWIIVGAETGPQRGKISPEKEWISNIQKACKERGTPLFMKGSIKELMGEDFIQEFPQFLVRETMGEKRRKQLFSKCGFCKKEYPKREMHGILAQSGRGQSALTIGHVCPDCLVDVEAAVQASRDEYYMLYSGECACCGSRELKSKMTVIYTRKKRLDPAKLLCYLCEDDMKKVKARLSGDKPWSVKL